MSLYRVQTFEPTRSGEVGWVSDGYFYAIYEGTSTVPESHGGLDAPIRSLFELMTVTWREIDWRAEESTAARLLTEGTDTDQREVATLMARLPLATAS